MTNLNPIGNVAMAPSNTATQADADLVKRLTTLPAVKLSRPAGTMDTLDADTRALLPADVATLAERHAELVAKATAVARERRDLVEPSVRDALETDRAAARDAVLAGKPFKAGSPALTKAVQRLDDMAAEHRAVVDAANAVVADLQAALKAPATMAHLNAQLKASAEEHAAIVAETAPRLDALTAANAAAYRLASAIEPQRLDPSRHGVPVPRPALVDRYPYTEPKAEAYTTTEGFTEEEQAWS